MPFVQLVLLCVAGSLSGPERRAVVVITIRALGFLEGPQRTNQLLLSTSLPLLALTLSTSLVLDDNSN